MNLVAGVKTDAGALDIRLQRALSVVQRGLLLVDGWAVSSPLAIAYAKDVPEKSIRRGNLSLSN